MRDFFVYLSPRPLSAFRPPAQPRCDKAPVAVHSRPAPFLVPRPCCRRCACRTVALDRKSAARTRAPMPVVAENDLPRFIVVCGARQIVSLGGEVMPRCRCVSRKDCRVLSKRPFLRARERVRTPQFFVFCLHPSPACVRRSKSNRCGEGKGEGLCSPLPSPLCGSELDRCGFWHESWHVFDQSPLLFRIFIRYFASASSEEM